MPWDESHTTWTGGQYGRPLSPEELAKQAYYQSPAYWRTLPKSVRDSWARYLRALRRKRLAATQADSKACPTPLEPEETTS
jgi:hypothetical protein